MTALIRLRRYGCIYLAERSGSLTKSRLRKALGNKIQWAILAGSPRDSPRIEPLFPQAPQTQALDRR
jgi:hypothetical protein